MKIRTSLTIDQNLLIKAKKIVNTKRYRNLSHLFEYALEVLINDGRRKMK